MQFYLNGYVPGDPRELPAAADRQAGPAALPDTVDVLIVGSGPAGCVLAAQLAAFPSIRTRLVEQRDGPLRLGQADGVACRTVEMLEAFGLSEKLVNEAYWVNETVFWRPAATDRAPPTSGTTWRAARSTRAQAAGSAPRARAPASPFDRQRWRASSRSPRSLVRPGPEARSTSRSERSAAMSAASGATRPVVAAHTATPTAATAATRCVAPR